MRAFVALVASGLLLAGCGGSGTEPTGDASLPVIASHYPVEYLVEQVGGDLVDVETLTSPGTEPHDLELSPQQVGQVQQADAVFYIEGFQPAVDQAIGEAEGTVVDLAAGLPLRAEGTDPHIWLDPVLMRQMAGTVADTLAAADPANAQTYQTNKDTLDAQLVSLDREWSERTQNCQIRTMVVSHEAFGYLADQYGFDQKGIAGLSPDSEPSAAAIAELATFVRDNGVTTVYTETLVDPAVAQTVAAEAGARTATLDPLEGPPTDGDYLTAMRTNLDTVAEGQSCA